MIEQLIDHLEWHGADVRPASAASITCTKKNFTAAPSQFLFQFTPGIG